MTQESLSKCMCNPLADACQPIQNCAILLPRNITLLLQAKLSNATFYTSVDIGGMMCMLTISDRRILDAVAWNRVCVCVCSMHGILVHPSVPPPSG